MHLFMQQINWRGCIYGTSVCWNPIYDLFDSAASIIFWWLFDCILLCASLLSDLFVWFHFEYHKLSFNIQTSTVPKNLGEYRAASPNLPPPCSSHKKRMRCSEKTKKEHAVAFVYGSLHFGILSLGCMSSICWFLSS